jgi:hypothetical protein
LVDVAVSDRVDHDGGVVVVDAVHDPIVAAPGAAEAFESEAQWTPDTMGLMARLV